jgi:hypothetical protein
MVQIQGQFNREDYLRGLKLGLRGNLMMWLCYSVCGAVAFLCFFGIAFYESTFSEMSSWSVWLGMLVSFLLFARFIMLPWNTSRQLKQVREATAPMKTTFDEDGWRVENEFGNYRLPWNAFVKWKQSRTTLLLYRSSRMFQIIPKRMLALPGDLDYITAQLHKAGVPDRTRNKLYPIQFALLVLLGLLALALIGNESLKLYAQRRNPIPSAEWQLIDEPGLVAFRSPGQPVDSSLWARDLAPMAVDGIEPQTIAWSTRREDRMFNVRVFEYPPDTALTVDALNLVLDHIDAAFGESNVVGYEEIERGGQRGIRINDKETTVYQ